MLNRVLLPQHQVSESSLHLLLLKRTAHDFKIQDEPEWAIKNNEIHLHEFLLQVVLIVL